MIFAKRQAATISQLPGIITSVFFLESRTSLLSLVRAWRAIRHRIREFQPDLVHAQFGTMTAFFCAVSTSRPLVVTYFGSDLNPIRSGSRIRALVGRVLSQLAALRPNALILFSPPVTTPLWGRRHPRT